MEKNILPFNWQNELGNIYVHSINDDFILLDKPIIKSVFDHPFKIDVVTAIICLKGTVKGSMDMKHYTAQGPCMIIVLPEQILEYESFSEDFSGLFIVLSKRFLEEMEFTAQESFPLSLSVRERPYIPLTDRELNAMVGYFNMMKDTISIQDHPYRMETAKYLTKAFFYGAGYYFHNISNNKKQTHQEQIVDNFLNHVQENYKHQRELNFYADKMCLTPKHLSKVIKESSRKSANEWINEYVILEAKALLKSTDMTIQQISDELNFPSQSFFGKYFKRITGLSPKEYKIS